MTSVDVLIIEDHANERTAMSRLFRAENLSVAAVGNVSEAVTWIDRDVGVMVTDLRLGDRSSLEILDAMKRKNCATPVIVLTAYGDVQTAVAAMKLGAQDFLTKPVNPRELVATVHGILRLRSVPCEPIRATSSLVGSSPRFLEALNRLERAAASDANVLLLGESGTGKELFARELHARSRRAERPFLAVNVAAIPETLLESELFGHAAGTFTGASAERIGWFEAADKGTLFIDEIGDLQLSAQAKLLRVLEQRAVTRLGTTAERPVDVRVVAATSRQLLEMIAAGEFREDLYYRLNVVSISLPTLRERVEDVPELARMFAAKSAESSKRPAPALSDELLDVLQSHPWPGNIRQLRNVIESMMVFTDRPDLTIRDLPAEFLSQKEDGQTGGEARLAEAEKSLVLQTLERLGNNRTKAAESLGISRRTLQRRLRAWGIADQEGPVEE